MRSGKVRVSVLRGAAVLSFSALIVKTIGAFFKVPLGNLLGGEGLSYYMTAFELFGPLYALTAAGVPAAVSRQISADPRHAKQYLGGWLRLFAAVGAGVCALFGCLAGPLCRLAGNEKAVLCAAALAPSLLFGCLSGCFRGYFQGHGQMGPTAISQLIESGVKVVLGLWICKRLLVLGYGAHIAAAGALAGVSASGLLSLLFLQCRAGRLPKEKPLPQKQSLKQMAGACIGTALCGFCATVDVFTVTRLVPDNGAFLYGAYSGLALTLCNLLPAVTGCLGTAALPAISAAFSAGSYVGGRVRALYKYVFMLAIPMGAGLCAMAPQLLEFLFSGRGDEVAAVTTPLRILCLYGVIWSAALTVFCVLQAVGIYRAAPLLCAMGAAIKTVLNIKLLPLMGIGGAAISSVVSAGAVLVYGIIWVYRATGGYPSPFHLLHIAAGSGLCCMTARLSFEYLQRLAGQSVATAACVILGGGVYFLYVAFCKLIEKTDLKDGQF